MPATAGAVTTGVGVGVGVDVEVTGFTALPALVPAEVDVVGRPCSGTDVEAVVISGAPALSPPPPPQAVNKERTADAMITSLGNLQEGMLLFIFNFELGAQLGVCFKSRSAASAHGTAPRQRRRPRDCSRTARDRP